MFTSKSPQHFLNSVFVFRLWLLFSDVLNVSGRINKPDNRKDMLDEDALAALAKGEPYFDKPPGWPPSGSVSSRGGYHNVSALIGKTAFLTCVVKNLGKSKSVSSKFLSVYLYGVLICSCNRKGNEIALPRSYCCRHV